jgi:ABC-2 type transport system permease protein
MQTSGYFRRWCDAFPDEAAARAALARGDVQFVVTIPVGLQRRLLRGEHPAMLIEADATDPAATGAALARCANSRRSSPGATSPARWRRWPRRRRPSRCACTSATTRRASPRYNIVPGLMGVILTMTMVMMTGLAMTRERERGTMENLLAMPAQPLEVMTGKIVPYIFIGLVQATIILLAALHLFGVPFVGSVACALRVCRCCSSPPASPSASRSRHWRRTSCRRCS